MKKEVFYFSHDYNARHDPKLVALAMKKGLAGMGAYWCIIEMLYEQKGYIPLSSVEGMAYEMHTDVETITDILKNHNLFKFKDERFFNESVLRRLKLRICKSDKARQSILKRWYPERYNNTDVIPTNNEGNTIKESKIKESKIKEKNKKSDFDFHFLDAKFIPVFMEWIDYKKSRNENYKTQKSLEACYRNLLRLSQNNPDKAKLVIDQAMGNNWQGLQPLKTEGQLQNRATIQGSRKYLDQ